MHVGDHCIPNELQKRRLLQDIAPEHPLIESLSFLLESTVRVDQDVQVSSLVTLCDHAGFLEAEISLAAIHRLTNDHVIEELDLENPGGFANPACEPQISFTRLRVTRWVVMYQDEGVG